MKLILLFNHELTKDQRFKAKKQLGCTEILSPPAAVQEFFSQIPAESELATEQIDRVILKWLKENSEKGDFVLIQGDFGSVYYIVSYCLLNQLIPVYSTNKRESEEQQLEDGTVLKRSVFKHCYFRRYKEWNKTLK